MKHETYTLSNGVQLTVEIHPNGMRRTVIPTEHREAYEATVIANAKAAVAAWNSNS